MFGNEWRVWFHYWLRGYVYFQKNATYVCKDRSELQVINSSFKVIETGKKAERESCGMPNN